MVMDNIKNLNIYQNIFLGSIGGSLDVILQHPMGIIKISQQSKQKIQFNYKFLYRGSSFALSTVTGITVVQYISYEKYYNLLSKYVSNRNSETFSSILSGITVSTIVSPIELMITQQTRYYNLKFSDIHKMNYNKYGLKYLYRGYTNLCIRESIFSYGLMSSIGLFENYFEDLKYKSIVSSVLAGTISSIISQPFDTLKTLQQYYIGKRLRYRKILTFSGLFTGGWLRLYRNCGFFFILNETNKFFTPYL